MPRHSDTTLSRRRILQTGAVLSGGSVIGSTATADRSAEAATRYSDAIAQTNPLECGDLITGELTEDDDTGFRSEFHFQDVYEFDGEEGEFVTISMTAIVLEEVADEETDDEADGEEQDDESFDDEWEDPPGDPYLYLLSPDGTIIAEDDDSGVGLNSRLVVPRLPETGTYTIIATSWGEEETFEYELTVECGAPFDPEPIACGDVLSGALTPDDPTGYLSDDHAHDAYSFDGAAGEYVAIGMNGLDVPINDECDTTFADPFLVLFGPEWELIAWDDDSGGDLNALINARLPTDGEYTVIATSWAPQMYFGYELSIECRDPLDPESISCGETVEGELTPDDESGIRNVFGQHFHDTYAFEGTAGEFVTITLQADRFSSEHDHHDFPLGDPYLYLFDPEGTLIAEDDDSAGDFGAMVQHLLPMDGEYTIVATSFGAWEFFPYELTLACEDEAPPLPEPVSIECGETVQAALEPTDPTGFRSPRHFYDHYQFEAAAGDIVTVSMASSEGDTFLLLLDPDGELIAADDDSGGNFDALIEAVELDIDGTYSIIATSFQAADTFEYGLTLQCL